MSFDLERFKSRRHVEAPNSPKPKKGWQRKYVKVPWSWVEKLTFSNSANTYRLALYLLYEYWRADGQPILLSNLAALQGADITRHAKRRALLELETLGVIQVERHHGRSPLVTILIGD